MPELFGDDAYKIFKQIDRVLILACGTSSYAGMTAKYWIESIAKVPVSVEVASEYRRSATGAEFRTPCWSHFAKRRTADTLAALKHARSLWHAAHLDHLQRGHQRHGARMRLGLHHARRREVGVASTKAFTTQLAGLFLLTLCLAQVNGHLSEEQEAAHLKAMRHLPVAIASVCWRWNRKSSPGPKNSRARKTPSSSSGMHYPIALEGALKLKEISYIHAEAYPAGELKHGPLALVTNEMPVVTIAPNDALIEKLKSNMQEVRARGGQLYVFADVDSRISSGEGLHVIRLPEHYGDLSPILHVVALQLLAYHTALARGTDVDKPRNLAKSVTVE